MPSYYSSWVANGTSSVTSAYRTRLDLTFNTGTSAQNYTDVIWSLYIENGNARFTGANSKGHVTINGVKVWDFASGHTNSSGSFNSSILLQATDGTKKATGTLRVPHENNGTKTIAYSASFETVNKSTVWAAKYAMTSSGTVALTTIPRYTSITALSTSSVQRDRFTINWTAADTISYWWYSLDNGSSWTAVGNPAAKSASRVITGRSPGTTYSVRVKVRRSDSGLDTISGQSDVKTEDGAHPNTPTISGVTRNSFIINVTANKSFNGFEYCIDGTWSAKQSGTSVTVTGRSPGTSYLVSVRVYDGVSTSLRSGQSTSINAVTEAIASPNTPTISGATRNSFTINVTANKSFNGFRYNINGGTWSDKKSGTSFTVTGRAAGTTHQVRVQVYDGVHTTLLSGQSAAVNAVTEAAASPNTPTFSSKTAVQVVFNWSSNKTVTNVQYKRWSSDGWQSAGSDFSARTSGSVTINGLSPNSGYSIRVRVKDAVQGTWSGESGALSVTTYALSTVKGTNFNLGSTVTATVTEAHTSMYHDIALEANYGGSWKEVASVTNQNKDASLTIPAAKVTEIENGTPNSKTVSMRLKVTTKWGSGGTVQGSAQTSPTFTATIVNANPTLSGITYKDNHSNTAFVAWKGGDQKILRNVSPVLATLGTATAIKGAKLSHYVFKINGKSFTVNANGAATQTGAIRDLGVINSANNENIEVTVYDSRDNSTPMSVPVSILDYIPPQVLTIEAQRLNNYEPATTLVVSGRSYIVKPATTNVNTYTAKYRIKQVGTSTWPSYTNVTVTKGTESGSWQNYSVSHYMGTFDSDTAYDIEFVFQDSVGTQYTQNAVLTQGIGLMTFLEDKVELGVPLYDKNSAKKYLLEGEGGPTSVSWTEVTGKPSTFAPSAHNQAWSTITSPPAQATRWPTWSEVTSKPTTFAPDSHTHAWAQVTGAPAQATRWPAWSEVTSKPTTFAPSTHSHAWADITSKPTTATRWPTWSEVTSKPTTFAPSTHTHGVTRTTLLGTTAFATNGTYNLGQSIQNFDLIIMYIGIYYNSASDNNSQVVAFSPATLSYGSVISGGYNFSVNRQYGLFFPNATQIKCNTNVGLYNPRIMIEGIKYTS